MEFVLPPSDSTNLFASSTPGSASRLAEMLPALRAVNTALQEGLITAEEHTEVRRKIMDGDRDATMKWVPLEVTQTTSTATNRGMHMSFR